MHTRSNALATRLERGVEALATFAAGLSDAEWMTPIPHDGRTVGVVVHHVGNMLPIEIQLAQEIAAGRPVAGVTWAKVHEINAEHAATKRQVGKPEALAFLRGNAKEAASAIRKLTDAELDMATPNSLYFDAVLTCQFMLEDHAVRHCTHHLGKIRGALEGALAVR